MTATDYTEVTALLRGTWALIEDRRHWTKGALARDANGREISSATNPDAVRWCAMGAMDRLRPHHPEAYWRAWHQLTEAAGELHDGRGLADVNDGPRGHVNIGRLYAAAITAVERHAQEGRNGNP